MKVNIRTLNQDPVERRFNLMEQEITWLKDQITYKENNNNEVNIICFSGEYDRLYAALTIAAGALTMGMNTHLFITFWAVNTLKKGGPGKAKFSKFNFMGLGKFMLKRAMKKKGVDDIETLYNDVKELGANIHLCDTTAELFGVQCSEINAGKNVDQCGVTTFLSHALKSKMVLFV